MKSDTPKSDLLERTTLNPADWIHLARQLERRLAAAEKFINTFSVSNSCECSTCRAMREYDEAIKRIEQQDKL